jgi:hypothetical protein
MSLAVMTHCRRSVSATVTHTRREMLEIAHYKKQTLIPYMLHGRYVAYRHWPPT